MHNRRAYWSGCRCEICRKAHTDYERERYRATTTKQLQDTEFVLPVIKRCVIARFAREIGVQEKTLIQIKFGRTKRIRQSTERKILRAS